MGDSRLTAPQIRDYVGGRSFDLGMKYLGDGAIFNARCEGTKLTASCRGSHRNSYRVRATLGGKGVLTASCTCPVGSGSCKHVAALLLAWAWRPELFREARETDALLAAKSKEELIVLVKQILRRRPELESLVEAMPEPGKPADPKLFKQQADAAFANASGDWDEAAGIAEELQTILDDTDELLHAKHWLDAAAIYQGVLESLIENAESIGDEDGCMSEVIGDCADGLGECLPKIADADRRMSILTSLIDVVEMDDRSGGWGFGDGAYDAIRKHGTPPDRWALVDLLRRRGADDDLVQSLEEDLLSDDEYLQRCRETTRHDALIERLLKLQRVGEAASAALHMDESLLPRIADLFVRAGQAQAAEEWMRQRAARSTRTELLRWLRDRCAARGDHCASLEFARREYQAKPTLDGYEEVRRLAIRLKQWESIRADALRLLASHPDQKAPAVQALVKEGLVNEAVSLMRSERLDHLGEWVAKSVEHQRPDVSIELYATAADRLIARRNRQNYRQACLVLSRIRKLCESLEEQDAWKIRTAAIRKRYAGLPALMEEMRKSKLIP
jgi:hypothetical protein